MAGQTVDAGSPSDYKFMDPNNMVANSNQMMNEQMQKYGSMLASYDPNAYMQQFMGQAGGLSNLVSGQNSQLQQTLNALAADQARTGGEQALAAMPGARQSGAAMGAFGSAYGNPFAQAQSQLQQNQLQGTLGLWGQAMGQNAQNQNAMLGTYGNLAGQTQTNLANQGNANAAWYQPTYQYQPGAFDYAMQGLGALGGLGTGLGGLGSFASALGLGGGTGGAGTRGGGTSQVGSTPYIQPYKPLAPR